MVLAAIVPLGFGLAGDFYVVLAKVLDAPALSAGLAATSLVFFFGLWFGVMYALRGAHPSSLEPIRAAR
jgi:hypothetical protein